MSLISAGSISLDSTFKEHFYLPLYLPLCVDLMLCKGLQGPGLDAEQHLLSTWYSLCRGPVNRKEVLPSAKYCTPRTFHEWEYS